MVEQYLVSLWIIFSWLLLALQVNMVSLLFQNGDTKYHVLVSQTRRINRLDVFYQLDFIDFIW